MLDRSMNRRHALGLAAGTLVGGVLLSACSSTSAASSQSPTNLDLTIVTSALTTKKDWPAIIPSNLTVPAHGIVNVRIFNFDDGTAPLTDQLANYAKVSGVTGNQATTQPLTVDNPNATGTGKTFTAMAPADVAHTFTILKLNLNVPMPVTSVVSFSFQAPDAGTYTWQCMAPCGTGTNNMGGAMAANGYMMGTLKVI